MSDSDKMYMGKIIFFSAIRGYGFISWEIDGIPQSDLFLHFSDISMQGYKTVFKDQIVSFQIGKNNKGQDKAINVKVLTN